MITASDFEDIAERDWQRTDPEAGPIRIAMIGIGWWTRDRAIPAVEASDRCVTTVAVSSSAEKANEVVETNESVEEGITYEEFHNGAATDAYDAVYIATPNAFHGEYVETAAELDKAVLCEKPMADTVENATALVESAGDATLMIAYRMQTEPLVRRMRELVRNGFVGEVVEARGRMSQSVLEMMPDPDQWRLDPDLSGYGTSVMDLGIYPLNTARFVLDSDPIRAKATMYSESEAFEDVPDERASFAVDFPGGVTLLGTASQNAHQADDLTIVGTDGELTLSDAFHSTPGRSLDLVRGDTRVTIDVDPVDQMEEEFEYFADCLLAGEAPHPDGDHGLTDMRALQAIYEAAERDEPVAIDRADR